MTQMYIAYLQKLLSRNKINFKSQDDFEQSFGKDGKQVLANSYNDAVGNIDQQQQLQQQEKQNYLGETKRQLETNMHKDLTGRLLERYSRQMLLKEISYAGQLKIINAKVALVGSGGIGCPLALYLAGAGVGTIGLFDSDTIEVTNLHRQIAHKNKSLGMKKTQSLKNSILQFNPNINVNTHEFITTQNMQQLSQYDFVIDGSDNPACRYIVNDYCMKVGKKLLSGACIGWEGQVTCYGGGNAPCYRCIWGNQQKTTGGCSSLGVIGMLPGIVGLILATQALKVIVNGKSSLEGSLLTFQCRQMTFRKVKLRAPIKDCLGCGQNKLNIQEYDYSIHSLCTTSQGSLPKVEEISWEHFLKGQQQESKPILDVRPSNHFNICHLKNMVNMPYEKLAQMDHSTLTSWLNQHFGDKEETIKSQQRQIFISCNRGVMSKRACEIINKAGFKSVSIIGGITEYSKSVDNKVPRL